MQNENRGHFYNFKIVAAVALIMAAVMFTDTPLGTAAQAESGKYVKDTMFISAKSAEEAGKVAKKEGYVINKESLYEEKYGGPKTFIAYQTTNNGAEAITDIKAMNMHGGWSYEEYQTHIDEMKANTKSAVSYLMIALKEFREEYKKDRNKENIRIAYELLNRIKDTDLDEDNGLADIMLKDDFTEDKFAGYYMQGNSKMVSVIEMALLIACSYTKETSFLENLKTFDFSFDYDSSEYAGYSAIILNQLKNLKSSIAMYVNSGVTYENGCTEQQMEEYIDTITDDEGYDPDYDDNNGALSASQKKLFYAIGAEVYGIIKDIPYKTDKNSRVNTLLDFVNSNVDEYATEDFYPLIAGMSDGQRALISIGLDQLICSADKNFEELKENYRQYLKNAKIDGNTTYDLYFEVNRRVYNPKGIAMTSDVLRDAAKGKTDWAKTPNPNGYKIADYERAMINIAICTGALILTIVTTFLVYNATTGFVDVELFTAFEFFFNFGPTTGPIGLYILIAVVAVAIIATIVMLVIRAVEQHKKRNDWLEIPEIICSKEVKNGKTRYVYYDAVKNQDGTPCDVGLFYNQSNNREWLELYTTTDSRVNKPILADSLTVTQSAASTASTNYVTLFGGSASQNLNNFNECSKKTYIGFKNDKDYVKTDTDTSPEKTSSVFSKASSWGFAAVGLALGLVGGTLIGTTVKRKKQETAEQ